MTTFVERIRRHSRDLRPIPTGEDAVLHQLDGIRAVAFDVYGTIVISASGDVGTDQEQTRGAAFRESLAAVGVGFPNDEIDGAAVLRQQIVAQQDRLRAVGIEYPEIDILEAWRDTLTQLRIPLPRSHSALPALAVEFECRTNPTWMMPHADDVLRQLRNAPLPLGIVSNAQFYTPVVIEAFFDATPEDLGFAAELQVYSYQHREAKPGVALYERSAAAFGERGIAPGEVLYIGNDLLKDVMPASRVGFRTALFAGDRRSLRRHEGDERVRDVTPDLVLTDLVQLPDCIHL